MSEELKTVLGFEARDAIATLGKMEVALKSYSTAMAGAAAATKRYNKIAKHVAGALRSVDRGATTSAEAFKRGADKIVKSSNSVARAQKKLKQQAKNTSAGMLISWQSVIRVFAVQTVHQVISKITSAMAEGMVAARAYEIAVAEIQTIAPEFRADFEGLSDAIKAFSDETGEPIAGVAEGVYQTLSNQVTDAAGAFKFMATAHAFATAAATDTASSVNLLSSVINSYGYHASAAAEVGGKLAKTIELGRIRGEEFANTFGRITTLSSQLGISLDEVLTSITVLTVSGMKWNEAFTLMSNVQLKLIRPTDVLKARFAELGVASAEAGIQAYGFQGFLAKITEESGASASALGSMFNRVRAIRGALGLTNENAERYVKNLELIQAAGEKELFARKEIVFKTNAKQVEIELNRVQNILTEDLGRSLNDLALGFMDTFGGGTETVKALGTAMAATVGIYTGWKVAIMASNSMLLMDIRTTTGAAAKLKVALMGLWKSPAILAIAAGAAVLAYLAYLNRLDAKARELRRSLEVESQRQLEEELAAIRIKNKAGEAEDKENLARLQRYLQGQVVAETEAVATIQRIREASLGVLKRQFEEKASAADTYFQGMEEAAKGAEDKIKALKEEIAGIHFDISDFKFDRATKGMDPLRKAYLGIQRSTELRRQAILASNRGEKELAATYNARAKAAAKGALQAADESKNRCQIARAEREVMRTMQSQISVRKDQIDSTEDQAKTIDAMSKQMELQKGLVVASAKEFGKLIKAMKDAKFDPIKIDKIKKKMKIVAKTMKEGLAAIPIDFEIADALDLRKEVVTILTGAEDGTFEIDINISRFEEKIKAMTKAVTPLQKLMAEAGLTGTATEKQIQVAESGKQAKKRGQATVGETVFRENIARELGKESELVHDLEASYAKMHGGICGGWTTLMRAVADAASGEEDYAYGIRRTMIAHAKRLNKAKTAYQELRLLVQQPILDEKAAVAGLERLGEVREEMLAAGDSRAAQDATEAMITSIKTVIEKRQELQDSQRSSTILQKQEVEKQRSAVGAMQPELKAREEALKAAGTAAQTGATGVAAASNQIIANLRAETAAANARNRALAGEASTAPVKRAFGGFIPSGTDTVPAMLTPGEFVMNAQASRKFASQLTAMNSGAAPQYLSQGGSVSNVGDIKITVNEASGAKQTAREVMSALRRETRKQTARI